MKKLSANIVLNELSILIITIGVVFSIAFICAAWEAVEMGKRK